jgi:phage gp29-like protein
VTNVSVNDAIIIGLIMLAVVAIVGAFTLARASARREKAWHDCIRRKEEDLRRSELFRKEAEWRYGDLVETVATRTDQAKGKGGQA